MGIIETIKMLTREEGIEIGIEQGMEKGEENKSFEVVTKMLQSKKFSISEIVNFTEVSEDFVKKVQKELR